MRYRINEIYRLIGVIFVVALLMAIPMLFVLSMCYNWYPFIKLILIVLNIGEFIGGFLTLFYL